MEYPEALFHLLRIKQTDPESKEWGTHCGHKECNYACEHDKAAAAILDTTWEHFLTWEKTHQADNREG